MEYYVKFFDEDYLKLGENVYDGILDKHKRTGYIVYHPMEMHVHLEEGSMIAILKIIGPSIRICNVGYITDNVFVEDIMPFREFCLTSSKYPEIKILNPTMIMTYFRELQTVELIETYKDMFKKYWSENPFRGCIRKDLRSKLPYQVGSDDEESLYSFNIVGTLNPEKDSDFDKPSYEEFKEQYPGEGCGCCTDPDYRPYVQEKWDKHRRRLFHERRLLEPNPTIRALNKLEKKREKRLKNAKLFSMS